MSFKIGDQGPQIVTFDLWLNRKFASYSNIKADGKYGLDEARVVAEAMRRYGLPPTFMDVNINGTMTHVEGAVADDAFLARAGYVPPPIIKPGPPGPPPGAPVLFTVNGAGVDMWTGYQADLGRALGSIYYWQPVGYDSKPFPMSGGIHGGVTELTRLLTDVHPAGPFAFCLYSEGAIIGSDVYDLLRDPNSAIGHRRKDFLGAVTFGNPRREHGHTIPGGIDPGGEGIVAPTLKDTEPIWGDLANGKNIPGAMGDDLYTTMCGATGQEAEVMRTIWGFVYNVWDGVADLTSEIFSLLGNPLGLSVGAVKALVAAITFFGTEHLGPHIDYQFSQPIPGDPRDSWRIAFDHLTVIGHQALK